MGARRYPEIVTGTGAYYATLSPVWNHTRIEKGPEMKIGDVVVPSQDSQRRGKIFHCGSGWYTHAIVGSIEPFILVSDSGDMVWSRTWGAHEVVALCQAGEEVQRKVFDRLENDRLCCEYHGE